MIEIGSTTMSLRNIIFKRVEQDFSKRGLEFTFPDDKDIINNKEVLKDDGDIFVKKIQTKAI